MDVHEPSRVGPVGIGILAVLICAVVGFYAVAGGGGETAAGAEDTLTRIKAAGKVTIGIANEAPYGYLDTKTGKVTGEAPEVLRAVLQRMGVTEIEVVNTEFGSLIPGLKSGRFDIIAAGMYITPERAKEILFSEPTYRIGEAFVVKAGNPKGLGSYAAIAEHADAKLGVVRGTVEQGYAEKLGIPADRVVQFGDNVAALEGVKTGQVDAFACTHLTAVDLLRKAGPDAGLERAEPFEQPVIDGQTVYGYGAFGVRPSDAALRDAINAELASFLGTPEHLKLVAPFGFGEATLPGDVTTAQLIAPTPGK